MNSVLIVFLSGETSRTSTLRLITLPSLSLTVTLSPFLIVILPIAATFLGLATLASATVFSVTGSCLVVVVDFPLVVELVVAFGAGLPSVLVSVPSATNPSNSDLSQVPLTVFPLWSSY